MRSMLYCKVFLSWAHAWHALDSNGRLMLIYLCVSMRL